MRGNQRKCFENRIHPCQAAGQEVCSPHMRGGSRSAPGTPHGKQVLSAHAGMVRSAMTPARPPARAPRTCGGGPRRPSSSPACSNRSPHVGMAPRGRARVRTCPAPACPRLRCRRPAHGILSVPGSGSPMDSRVLQVEYCPHPAAVFCGVRSARDRAQAGQFRQDGCARDRETWPVGQGDDQRLPVPVREMEGHPPTAIGDRGPHQRLRQVPRSLVDFSVSPFVQLAHDAAAGLLRRPGSCLERPVRRPSVPYEHPSPRRTFQARFRTRRLYRSLRWRRTLRRVVRCVIQHECSRDRRGYPS